MTYQIYQTPAIVLKSSTRSEADKVFTLYTQAFGLTYAQARSVREERSKLRYQLADLSVGSVSLVQGKRGWRLVGASVSANTMGASPASVRSFARIATLTSKLVHGEEENRYLFDVLANAQSHLLSDPCAHAEEIEILCVVRVLFALGYVAPKEEDRELFTHAKYGTAVCEHVAHRQKHFLKSINTALGETHL